MPESKNEYVNLKVPQSNFYTPYLYGKDIEEFQQGSSRQSMVRYVMSARFSKYLLILAFIISYCVGYYDLGEFLPSDFYNSLISKFSTLEVLYENILRFGGDKKDFYNIAMIQIVMMPLFFLLGIYLSILELIFLARFNFSGFLSKIGATYGNLFSVFLAILLFSYLVNYSYVGVGEPNRSSRLSILVEPVNSVFGYTIYGATAYVATRGTQGLFSSIYILILMLKGGVK